MTRLAGSLNSAEPQLIGFAAFLRKKSQPRKFLNRGIPNLKRRFRSSILPQLAERLNLRSHFSSKSAMESQSPIAETTSPAAAVEEFADVTSPSFESEPSPNPNIVAEDRAAVELGVVDAVQLSDSDHGSDVEGESSEQRRELPEELAKEVMVLNCESSAEGETCVVYVVGTAHVSQESCREVQEVVSCLKPEVVFLELCVGRVAILSHQDLKVPTFHEMLENLKKKQNPFGIFYGWFLAKIANQLEVFPGAEFRVAFDEAMKYGGKVILGDRPIQITLRRTWAKLPLWHKTKLISLLFFQSMFLPSAGELNRMLKEMNDSDMLTLVVQEMSKQFPTLMETLVHERDQYMSSTLLTVAKQHSSVVAVVGKGHLQGIRNHWQQPIDVAKLLEMPSHKPIITVKRIIGTLGAGVAAGAIVGGLFLSRKK